MSLQWSGDEIQNSGDFRENGGQEVEWHIRATPELCRGGKQRNDGTAATGGVELGRRGARLGPL